MKRAALIITDADHIEWYENGGPVAVEYPSEQLLAALRTLERHADSTVRALVGTHGRDGERWSADLADAAARVRALLPEEDDSA